MHYKIFLSVALSILTIVPIFSKNHPTSISQVFEAPTHSQCFFIPPDGWEIADPRSLSSQVKIAFLKNTGTGFFPSINLAVEETSVSLSEYLKAVKAIHEQDRNNTWRALGKVRTNSGLAQLTEIDSTNEWGPVRILQLILVKEGYAYVLTAAALKEEMSNYYKNIQSAFRSFTLTNDLFSSIPQLERKEMLKQKQNDLINSAELAALSLRDKKNILEDKAFQENQWIPFQKVVFDHFGDMGTFWQILILRNVYQKLLSFEIKETSEEKVGNNAS